MKKKCKYCKTKIALSIWLFFLGKCIPCDMRIERVRRDKTRKIYEKQIKDSNKYWNSLK